MRVLSTWREARRHACVQCRDACPFNLLGELVDLEVDVRTYRGKDETQHISLRVVAYKGEF
jgi:hypothetical protein